MGNPVKDITNEKYGMLTVIKRAERPREKTDSGAWWLVKCDCGKEKIMRANTLRTMNTKSCGCSSSMLKRKARLLERGLSAKNDVFKYYQRRAKKLKYSFKLSFENFIEIVQLNCYYCDAIPSNIRRNTCNNGDFVYNGVDRLNNNKGYTPNNCVPCCKICNIAKNNRSKKDFYSWIRKIYKKWGQK